MKNKIILSFYLMVLTSIAVFAAEPTGGCWVNILKNNDPRCPTSYSSYREVLADVYYVSCVRIYPIGGFIEAEQKSIGYNKVMHCINDVWYRTVTCEYLCRWTQINGPGIMDLYEYKSFWSPHIPSWEEPCLECSSD